jgi:hypothetical protein
LWRGFFSLPHIRIVSLFKLLVSLVLPATHLYFFLQFLTAVVVMRPIALVSVALALSASALPRIVLGRDLGHNESGEGLEKRRVNNGTNPQNTLSKCNESSLTSQRLYSPSSVGSQGHLHQL